MTILIGHGGASASAPANTIASFEAARRAGVDMIEFDVRLRGSRLLVAHPRSAGSLIVTNQPSKVTSIG